MSLVRRIAACGVAVAAFGLSGSPGPAQTPQTPQPPPPSLAPCRAATVALRDTLDSANAKPGDAFSFQLVDATVAPDGTPLPAGTVGYGIVANATHADKGGRPGYLALETRFFDAGGKHVAAIIDRANDEKTAATGSTANAPGVLGYIPIVGYAVGGYDALHHGRDATIARGTRFPVFVGDDVALGTCRKLAAGESPPPVTPAPAAAPAPAATAAPAPSASPSPHP